MFSRISKFLFSNAYVLLCLTALFWAGNFVLGRGISGHIPPISLAWFRWTLAFCLVLPFTYAQVQQDWPVIKKNILNLTFLGILSVGAFNTLAYIGLNYTSAINALILQSSGPVLIAIMAFFIFKDRLSAFQMVGIVASLIGVFVVIFKGDISAIQSLQMNIGDIWIFTAMAVWAVYTVFYRTRPNIHWKSFIAVTFGIGALAITPLFIGELMMGGELKFDIMTVLSFLYVAIFPSTLAYLFYNRGIELVGANRAGAFLHMVPFFGGVLAIIFLGESLQLFHIVGFALILSGVWLASRKA